MHKTHATTQHTMEQGTSTVATCAAAINQMCPDLGTTNREEACTAEGQLKFPITETDASEVMAALKKAGLGEQDGELMDYQKGDPKMKKMHSWLKEKEGHEGTRIGKEGLIKWSTVFSAFFDENTRTRTMKACGADKGGAPTGPGGAPTSPGGAATSRVGASVVTAIVGTSLAVLFF